MKTQLIEYGRRGLKLDFPVIDVHAHIGDFGSIVCPSLDVQVREMDSIGIKAAIVSSIDSIHGDFYVGNSNVASAIEKFRGRIYGYCHVSAQYPEEIEPEIDRRFRNKGFIGIKVYQVGTSFDNPLYEPVWKFAEREGLPVLAHTWGGNLTGFDKVALRHRKTVFLTAHSGSGFAYKPYIDAAKKIKNLYLDLTYSREHTNMIELFVKEVGADKIVWGSDAPTFSMSQQLGKILFARISDSDKMKILYGNTSRLFGIK